MTPPARPSPTSTRCAALTEWDRPVAMHSMLAKTDSMPLGAASGWWPLICEIQQRCAEHPAAVGGRRLLLRKLQRACWFRGAPARLLCAFEKSFDLRRRKPKQLEVPARPSSQQLLAVLLGRPTRTRTGTGGCCRPSSGCLRGKRSSTSSRLPTCRPRCCSHAPLQYLLLNRQRRFAAPAGLRDPHSAHSTVSAPTICGQRCGTTAMQHSRTLHTSRLGRHEFQVVQTCGQGRHDGWHLTGLRRVAPRR